MDLVLFSWLIGSCVTLLSNATLHPSSSPTTSGSPTIDVDLSGVFHIMEIMFIVAGVIVLLIILGIAACCYCGIWASVRICDRNRDVPHQVIRVEDAQLLGNEREIGLNHGTQRNIVKRMSQNYQSLN